MRGGAGAEKFCENYRENRQKTFVVLISLLKLFRQTSAIAVLSSSSILFRTI